MKTILNASILACIFLFNIIFLAEAQSNQEISKRVINDSVNIINATVILSDDYNFVIKGKVKNYVPSESNSFAQITINELDGAMKSHTFALKADGTFEFHGKKPNEGEITFSYDGVFIPLYVQPYESIVLEIDPSRWKKNNPINDALKITGPSANTSRSMIDFQEILDKHFEKAYQNIPQTDSAMAVFYKEKQTEQEALLESYIEKNHITDDVFIKWYRNEIAINASNEIGGGLFGGRLNDKVSYEQYFDYTTSIPVLNRQAYNNSSFYQFLHYFSSGIQIIGNNNPLYKDSTTDNFTRSISIYRKYASGLQLDLLYYNMFNKFLPAQKTAILDSLIRNDFVSLSLRKELNQNERKFISFNLLDSLTKNTGGRSLSLKLQTALKKYPGHLILMDFWSLSCPPCMDELPVFPKLMDELSGKPFAIFFMEQNRQKKPSDMIKVKYGLRGDFFDLTPNEVSLYNLTLGFNAIPRHFLLDANGNVIEDSMPAVIKGDDLNPDIVKFLNERLKSEEIRKKK